MKKYVDGEYIEMTPEEIEEIEEMAAEAENTPPPEPTTEEKLAALMAAIEGGLTNG